MSGAAGGYDNLCQSVKKQVGKRITHGEEFLRKHVVHRIVRQGQHVERQASNSNG